MKSYGLTINLVDSPEVIEQYKKYHENVWPEILENSVTIGIQKTKIFLLGRQLFLYMETTDSFDLDSSFIPSTSEHPRVKEWGELMESFQEPVKDAEDGEWWARMELVHES